MFLGLKGRVSMMPHIFVTWDFFSFCILALAWIRMLGAKPSSIRNDAAWLDYSRTIIFVFAVISACSSLLALVVLLGTVKDLPAARLASHILLSVVTVVTSWLLVHTVFALRYAHSFYGFRDGPADTSGGGLEFPGEKAPDYIDFAYFSFVIGMTCQVSDVQISSRSIRRLALIHGLISFAFNTFILALTINIISGLL